MARQMDWLRHRWRVGAAVIATAFLLAQCTGAPGPNPFAQQAQLTGQARPQHALTGRGVPDSRPEALTGRAEVDNNSSHLVGRAVPVSDGR
jgi:hypothetical protein